MQMWLLWRWSTIDAWLSAEQRRESSRFAMAIGTCTFVHAGLMQAIWIVGIHSKVVHCSSTYSC
jgi:hypothetical protein